MTLYVVTGPPCAGKSTWVRQRAKVGDIVVDLDRIALALTAESCEHHAYPNHVRMAAMQVRKSAVAVAMTHARRGQSYIIHAKPPKAARAAYKRMGAIWVNLTAPMPVLMERAMRERPPHVWRILETWYEDAEE